MSEVSWFWDGDTGDGGSYGHTVLMDRYFRMLAGATGNLGVFDGWLNELEVTDGGANTATIATGAAMVYGGFYESDAAVDVTIPNGPRTDLIVVRRSWANKTARITRIAGPGAALTQVAGTTWDIPLADVDVDGAGALTITDTREYTVFPTVLADGAVHSAAIATGAVTAAKLEDQTRWISFGAGALKPEAGGTSDEQDQPAEKTPEPSRALKPATRITLLENQTSPCRKDPRALTGAETVWFLTVVQ